MSVYELVIGLGDFIHKRRIGDLHFRNEGHWFTTTSAALHCGTVDNTLKLDKDAQKILEPQKRHDLLMYVF